MIKGKTPKRKSRILKIALIFLSTLVFLVISESLYILNNKPASLFSYYLNDVRASTTDNDLPKAMNYIQTGSKILIWANCRKYQCPTKISVSDLNLLKRYPILDEPFLNQLKGIDLENNSVHPDYKLGKIYYSWGLKAYKEGITEIAPILWQKAIYLNPELPTLHLELINFYLVLGDEETARKFLDFCLNIPGFSEKGCQKYFERHFSTKLPQEVGFWEKEIEEHYLNR